jgi:hypothetical protein
MTFVGTLSSNPLILQALLTQKSSISVEAQDVAVKLLMKYPFLETSTLRNDQMFEVYPCEI